MRHVLVARYQHTATVSTDISINTSYCSISCLHTASIPLQTCSAFSHLISDLTRPSLTRVRWRQPFYMLRLRDQTRKLTTLDSCTLYHAHVYIYSFSPCSRQSQSDLPVAMRYRKCQRTYKQKVGVYQSHIHGLGLYCLQEIEAGDMVIEYAGTVIRSILTDKREKYYDSKVLCVRVCVCVWVCVCVCVTR